MGLLSILLTILKIIGITLLVILGIILLIIGLILFVPIRYNIDIAYKEKPDIRVRVTYLLRLLRVYFEYNTESRLTIKVLCFNLSKGDKSETGDKAKKAGKKPKDDKKSDNGKSDNEKSGNEKAKKNKKKLKEDDFEDNLLDDDEIINADIAKNSNSESIPYENCDSNTKTDTDIANNKEHTENNGKDTEANRKDTETDNASSDTSDKATTHNSKSKADKSKENNKNSKSTHKKTGNNSSKDGIMGKGGHRSANRSHKERRNASTSDADGLVSKIKSIIALIKENKPVIAFVWDNVKKLFKHILPGSHVINLKLGLDDPATLGEILGVASVARAGTNLQINITPDFENKVIEADCHFKGRIRIFNILYIALKVYFNKDVKKIINKLKA